MATGVKGPKPTSVLVPGRALGWDLWQLLIWRPCCLQKNRSFYRSHKKKHLSPAALTECSWSGDGRSLCCGAFSLVNIIEIKNFNLFKKRASHGLIQAASHRKSRAHCGGAHISFPEGLDRSAENKTQLWGARSCFLEVETSERSRAAQAVGEPWGRQLCPAPPHPSRSSAPTPAGRSAPRPQHRSLPRAGLCAIPAGAELSAEQTLRVTSRILPVVYSSTITPLPPERDIPLHLPKGEIPPACSPRCPRPEGGRREAEGCGSQALSG